MKQWSDLFRNLLETRWGAPPDPAAVRARYAWIEDLHARAAETLRPEALETMDPPDIYARLKALSVPRCPIRIANLGRMNAAAEVAEAVRRLMAEPGNLAQKFRAAKIAQIGMVTATELLCVARPHRFMLRNTAFLRAAPKVIPFYTRAALKELPYEEFLDTCRELARVQETVLEPVGLGEWARTYRFLLLYAVLTEPESKD